MVPEQPCQAKVGDMEVYRAVTVVQQTGLWRSTVLGGAWCERALRRLHLLENELLPPSVLHSVSALISSNQNAWLDLA